jgi:ribonuclease P protein component
MSIKEQKIKHTFKKRERLCSKKLLDKLFRKGSALQSKNFRFLYCFLNEQEKTALNINTNSPIQIVVSVSKKSFKNAVDRNYIKRITREIYRTKKSSLYELVSSQNQKMLLAIIYTGKQIVEYADADIQITNGLNLLGTKIKTNEANF